jgi:hypothetical protein
MKNIKLLEQKKIIRDAMLEFMLSGEEITFDNALRLNNHIAKMSKTINFMKHYSYDTLQKDADDYTIEIPSKLNGHEEEI